MSIFSRSMSMSQGTEYRVSVGMFVVVVVSVIMVVVMVMLGGCTVVFRTVIFLLVMLARAVPFRFLALGLG